MCGSHGGGVMVLAQACHLSATLPEASSKVALSEGTRSTGLPCLHRHCRRPGCARVSGIQVHLPGRRDGRPPGPPAAPRGHGTARRHRYAHGAGATHLLICGALHISFAYGRFTCHSQPSPCLPYTHPTATSHHLLYLQTSASWFWVPRCRPPGALSSAVASATGQWACCQVSRATVLPACLPSPSPACAAQPEAQPAVVL